MYKTILQVPITKELKLAAEKAASNQGFSSLQEVIRIFLAKLAENRIQVSFNETVQLSNRAEKRYTKIDNDFKNKKNIYQAKNVEELMYQLNDDSKS